MSVSVLREGLAAALLSSRPAVSAAVIEHLSASENAEMFARQTAGVAALVLERMLPSAAARVIAELGERAGGVLAQMAPARAAIALRWLPEEERESALATVGGRAGRELRDSLSYPDNSAGALMDPRVNLARSSDTAAEAMT